MKNIRTDLAMEARELWRESAENTTELAGVTARESQAGGIKLTRVDILDQRGVQALGKPCGAYTTLEIPGIITRDEEIFTSAADTLSAEISRMMPDDAHCTLVVGLGNRHVTPDAVGSCAVGHIMVTRHLTEKLPDMFGHLSPVAAICPNVIGMTGIESCEIIRGVSEKIRPDCIIVIDALAARRMSRLCRTVQITDTGIVPGSGVGNSRAAINREQLGVPVIAVGVPTVADIRTVFRDTAEDAGISITEEELAGLSSDMMVTPKEIDVRVADIAKMIGYGINSALHPGISREYMEAFLA